MGDVIDVARNLEYHCNGRISCTCYKEEPVKAFDEVKNKFFLRMQVKNTYGVLACITKSIPEIIRSSIARVVQKAAEGERAELVIGTEKIKRISFERCITGIERNGEYLRDQQRHPGVLSSEKAGIKDGETRVSDRIYCKSRSIIFMRKISMKI